MTSETALLDTYLRDRDVADALGISRVTVWRWSRCGRLPAPVRLGEGVTRWRMSQLVRWQQTAGGVNGSRK